MNQNDRQNGVLPPASDEGGVDAGPMRQGYAPAPGEGPTPPIPSARVYALVICNPKSGRGQAGRLLASIETALRARGVDVGPAPGQGPDAWPDPASLAERPPDAVVVLGGDGSVFYALPAAVRLGTPIYHVPVGTENLFAREFGMTRSADRLADAVVSRATRRVDVGELDGAPFAVMASFGPDASVVHRLAGRRTGPITHLSYVLPSLRESLRPALKPVLVEVDGRTVFDGGPALVVVANSRQYGARFDPALDARIDDGLLDVVVMPASSSVSVLAWAAACRLRAQRGLPGLVYARGQSVRLAGPRGLPPCQADGEAITLADPACATLRVRPGALSVLAPAHPAAQAGPARAAEPHAGFTPAR